MPTMQERAKRRKDMITITKTSLHSKNHNSFHLHLSDKEAWELLAKISKEAYFEQTGKIASNRVDKLVVKFITRKESN